MKKIKSMLPFFGGILIALYVLPFLIKDMGSAMLVLFIFLPLVYFVTTLLCSVKNGFHIVFSMIAAVLFLPSMFLFYNMTAWIYAPVFGVISLIGNLIGGAIHRGKREDDMQTEKSSEEK